MRAWLILIGIVVVGLAYWLFTALTTGPQQGPPQPAANVSEQPGKSETESSEGPAQPPQETEPQETVTKPEDLSELLCPGTEGAPKPEPRLPSLKVMAACVVAQGRVMFTTVLPNGDYLVKIWPSGKYTPLREGCRPVATAELSLEEPYLVITIAKDDWPKFSPILRPEGPGNPYKLAIPVTAQGVYVFSPETNRHVYGPHCEIHPLEKLELVEEEKEAGK